MESCSFARQMLWLDFPFCQQQCCLKVSFLSQQPRSDRCVFARLPSGPVAAQLESRLRLRQCQRLRSCQRHELAGIIENRRHSQRCHSPSRIEARSSFDPFHMACSACNSHCRRQELGSAHRLAGAPWFGQILVLLCKCEKDFERWCSWDASNL